MPITNNVPKNVYKTTYLTKNDLDSMEYFSHKGGLWLYRDKDWNMLTYVLVVYRGNRPYSIGHINLKKCQDGYRVHWLGISRKYHGTGVAEWLYGTLLENGMDIVSGSTQSKGAKALWARLMEKYNCTGDEWDLDTKKKLILFC